LNDYNSYETEVKRIQNYYTAKRTEEALNEIINSTITQANKISNPLLLGRIFGLESILRIKHKSVLKFIRNPHPVQIATILLLIQNQQNGGNFNIRNGMAEVKTG
jgi:flagellar motor switch protein FliG